MLAAKFISSLNLTGYRRRPLYAIYTLLACVTLLVLNNVFGVHESVIDTIQTYQEQSNLAKLANVKKVSQFAANEKNVIFPRNFYHKKYNEFSGFYDNTFGEKDPSELVNIFKFNGNISALTGEVEATQYNQHNFSVFDSKDSIAGDINKCGEISKPLNFGLSNYQKLEDSLSNMVRKLAQQLEHDPAIKELKPFFNDDLQRQLEAGKVQQHWFKFAGTSVWLEQYGVHLMISRALYSSKGDKRSPNLSLAYAQVFNEKWEELQDVELIIPTKNPHSFELLHHNMNFPCILPIPFYHDLKYQKKRFYGPEDPRILLVRNEDGNEEPLIIYNAYHRKLHTQESIDEEHMSVSFNYYRSMFMTWPFQRQVGKREVDGLSDPAREDTVYSRTVELRREGRDRLEVQKNWTPFVSAKDRDATKADNYIYFIYRWSNLEILKCPLTGSAQFGQSNCQYDYRRDPELSENTEVGPLRGGTEMISLHDILPQPMINPDKEVWVGFARAHIKACGCGKDMYRPNLAVLTREGANFKLSSLSSFISLDIPVDGWTNPNIQCAKKDPNALIPNGISSWVARQAKVRGKDAKSRSVKVVDDYMTLTLSVADASVHTVHIKNLLRTLLDETSLFSYDNDLGYTNDVVDCSIKTSIEFCAGYGEEQRKLGKTLVP